MRPCVWKFVRHPACHRVGSTRITRGWLFNAVGEFSPKPPFFEKVSGNTVSLQNSQGCISSIHQQPRSSTCWTPAPLLRPVDGSLHSRKQLRPRGACGGRRTRHLSARSYHSALQVGFSKEPNAALRLRQRRPRYQVHVQAGQSRHMDGTVYISTHVSTRLLLKPMRLHYRRLLATAT